MKKLNMTSAEVNAALNKKKVPKKSDKSMSAAALIENLRKQMNEMKSTLDELSKQISKK